MGVWPRLKDWYHETKRPLPWRESGDPYAIWLSEVMSQQTRVEVAVPYYHRFLEKYPDVKALAQADTQELLKLWEGLGYYSRARNLQKAACQILSQHQGEIPRDPEAFRALPGVGEYTCGAVLSIAFGQPLPAVDGNVLRVVARLEALEGEIDQNTVKREIRHLVQGWIPEEDPGTFNQALMELGARICRPRTPVCGDCPLSSICLARELGKQKELPRRSAKKARNQLAWEAALIVCNGQVRVEQRPESGLLAGMWQLPMQQAGLPWEGIELGQSWGVYTFVFSHQEWSVQVYTARQTGEVAGCWVDAQALSQLPMGGPAVEIREDILKRRVNHGI